MSNLIWFEWEKCPDGYTIEELRAEYLTFESDRRITAGVPAKSAPAWVSTTSVWKSETDERPHHSDLGSFDFPIQMVVPKSERIVRSSTLIEESPGAFMMFANSAGSIEKSLLFIEQFGYPQKSRIGLAWADGLARLNPDSRPHRYPLGNYSVDQIYKEADNLGKSVRLWEEAKLKGSYASLIFDLNEFDHVDMPEPVDSIRVYLRENRVDRTQPPQFSIMPRSLEDALWLQFKIALSNNTQLQQCTECPMWFAYGTGTGRRKSALYCSPKCSKAAYRRRKAASQ